MTAVLCILVAKLPCVQSPTGITSLSSVCSQGMNGWMWVHVGWAVTLVGCTPSRGTATSAKTAQTKSALICVASAMTEAYTSLDASTSSTPQVLKFFTPLVNALSFAARMTTIAAKQASLQAIAVAVAVTMHFLYRRPPTLQSACACICGVPPQEPAFLCQTNDASVAWQCRSQDGACESTANSVPYFPGGDPTCCPCLLAVFFTFTEGLA